MTESFPLARDAIIELLRNFLFSALAYPEYVGGRRFLFCIAIK
jgi:hypothetical protein